MEGWGENRSKYNIQLYNNNNKRTTASHCSTLVFKLLFLISVTMPSIHPSFHPFLERNFWISKDAALLGGLLKSVAIGSSAVTAFTRSLAGLRGGGNVDETDYKNENNKVVLEHSTPYSRCIHQAGMGVETLKRRNFFSGLFEL